METVSFKGLKRDLNQKAATLRKDGRIPAVLYGGEILEHFTTTLNDIKSLIYTPDFKLGEVEIDGAKHKCIVKSIQYHPVKDTIEHMDFLVIKEGRKVKVELPVRFKGESPGVKNGGKLMQSLRRVAVKLDPAHLVDELYIDISDLELGNAVKVKDIEENENIEFMVNTNIPVASVEVPRALKSADAEAEEAGLEVETGAEAPAETADAE
ncbi:MAG: 50S ribosomal protein L25 [Saprospiraceae bacterium]|nr:50S ribosomal protein L25 [Bacteroidia bacterium]MBT8230180.1 50S ribosomal protein L25 [Bacteroidia bacterium]NNF20828.1 50S ribosomal protein L25 [Saprospiraceae bacterium]